MIAVLNSLYRPS